MKFELGARARLELPDDFASSTETRDGSPKLWRFFSGPVVVAVSAERLPAEGAVGLVGEVLAAYTDRHDFVLHGIGERDVDGAEDSYQVEMEWQSTSNVLMRSTVVVSVSERDAVVVHTAYPIALEESADSSARRILGSLVWA